MASLLLPTNKHPRRTTRRWMAIAPHKTHHRLTHSPHCAACATCHLRRAASHLGPGGMIALCARVQWLPTGLPRLRRRPRLPRLRPRPSARESSTPRIGAVRVGVVVLGLEGEQGYIRVNVELGYLATKFERPRVTFLMILPSSPGSTWSGDTIAKLLVVMLWMGPNASAATVQAAMITVRKIVMLL